MLTVLRGICTTCLVTRGILCMQIPSTQPTPRSTLCPLMYGQRAWAALLTMNSCGPALESPATSARTCRIWAFQAPSSACGHFPEPDGLHICRLATGPGAPRLPLSPTWTRDHVMETASFCCTCGQNFSCSTLPSAASAERDWLQDCIMSWVRRELQGQGQPSHVTHQGQNMLS